MTQMHRMAIEDEFGPDIKVPVLLWREAMNGNRQIPDPFGYDIEVYRRCRTSIEEAVPYWVEYAKKHQ